MLQRLIQETAERVSSHIQEISQLPLDLSDLTFRVVDAKEDHTEYIASRARMMSEHLPYDEAYAFLSEKCGRPPKRSGHYDWKEQICYLRTDAMRGQIQAIRRIAHEVTHHAQFLHAPALFERAGTLISTKLVTLYRMERENTLDSPRVVGTLVDQIHTLTNLVEGDARYVDEHVGMSLASRHERLALYRSQWKRQGFFHFDLFTPEETTSHRIGAITVRHHIRKHGRSGLNALYHADQDTLRKHFSDEAILSRRNPLCRAFTGTVRAAYGLVSKG